MQALKSSTNVGLGGHHVGSRSSNFLAHDARPFPLPVKPRDYRGAARATMDDRPGKLQSTTRTSSPSLGSMAEVMDPLMSIAEIEGTSSRLYYFSEHDMEIFQELRDTIAKASKAFGLVAITNITLSIITAEEGGSSAEVFHGLTIGDFAYWGDSFMMVLLTQYALGPFDQVLSSKSNQMQYVFNGLNRLGLLFQQMTIGAFAISTVCALEAAVKYPPIVTAISLGFFTLGTLRSLAMWWVLAKHTSSDEEVIRTLSMVRGDVAKGTAPAIKRSEEEDNVVLQLWDRTAVFLAFGYLIEFEEKIPSMDDTDKDDYQFNQSEVRVLNSMVDSAGVAALMLSLQAFSVLMLTVAEAGTGDSAGVVSDGINFFNKAVTAVIVFSAIRGCDQALHAETGSNVDHLLQSLSNKGITKLFEHLATLAIAVSIAGTAGILLPMLEESPLAAGLADGASHATAEELLQSLEWMAKLGEGL